MNKKTILYFALAIFYQTSCNTKNNKMIDEKAATTTNQKDTSQFTSGYSDVNGLKMYYEIHGTGEPLVLIHGGGSTIQTTFGRIIPALSKNRQIIAVELQAHGHTNDRNSPESFEQDADDVAALLHNLHISKASFFGFSNGGNTAMQIAIRHPEIVNKLVIASSFYKREGMQPGFFERMQHATLNDMPQVLKDAFLQINPDSNRLLNMFNKDKNRMLQFTDWNDEAFRSIKAPALIICGDRDVVLPGHAVVMSGLIANSRLMIVPAEHGSYIGATESPDPGNKMIELTIEIIESFLTTQ